MRRTTGRSTLKEVAERAGVSIGTASAVFAGKTWVSPATGSVVRRAAEELGYRPRARRPAETGMIGFVSWVSELFSPGNLYYAPVVYGAQQACAELDLSMTYEVIQPRGDRLPLCVERGQVAGLLVLNVGASRDYLARILDAGVSCVLLEHAVIDLPVDYVRHDDETGGYLATRHLIGLGHTSPPPAIITAGAHIVPAAQRLAGYHRACAEHGLTPDPAYVRPGDFTARTGYEQMTALLDLPVPPTAVFCANDLSAFGALDALRERGLRVPGDVSVIGYDDVAMAAHASPPLTTIASDKELLGAQAVWHLVQRVRRPETTSRDTMLGVRLVERRSTAPPHR
ncbi:LacI family DNA-binding transcriptional regulator [Microbispora amethystogenes]|uniref:LacI family transcriptional regulator n=1 Tax=Microbispora amethystogenes TaxID=1427754 RepID=A0ABQ4FF09_9ACTN|nr:LacI family DNA-binding transcriptional regulator [Microbispora amethystogenes]GIH33396.1 LacI family transcriptional regulator [Microbispora amethystogenes]